MPETADFLHLLDVVNVRAVEWDDDEGTLIVRVAHKVPDDQLPHDANILNLVDVPVEVIDEGDPEGRGHYEFFPAGVETVAEGDRGERQRPVHAGLSEIHYDSTAATAGQYKAEVVDTSQGAWSEAIAHGDLVRTSNAHVYAQSGEAEFGDAIVQPSPVDGGDPETDVVGHLVGFVPFEDGVTVDIACRTTEEDVDEPWELDNGYGHDIYRGDFSDKRGARVATEGRTSGVTVPEIENISAAANVNTPVGVIRFEDVVITSNDGEGGGDSGSPAYFLETGEFCMKLFAGSLTSTIFCKVANIEAEQGIRYLPNGNEPPEDIPEPPREHPICRLLRIFLPDSIVDPICNIFFSRSPQRR